MKFLLTTLLISLFYLTSFGKIFQGSVKWADGSETEIANIEIPMLALEEGIYFVPLQKAVKIERDGVFSFFSPKDVKHFSFTYKGVKHKVVSIPKSFNAWLRYQKKPKKNVFVLQEVDGKMKGYRYYEKQWWNILQHYQDPHYIFQKNGENPHYVKFLLFKIDTHKYVKDCKPAQELVKKRETLRQSPMDLVKLYNKECG